MLGISTSHQGRILFLLYKWTKCALIAISWISDHYNLPINLCICDEMLVSCVPFSVKTCMKNYPPTMVLEWTKPLSRPKVDTHSVELDTDDGTDSRIEWLAGWVVPLLFYTLKYGKLRFREVL